MSIRLAIPTYLQPFTNNLEVVEVDGRTVGECLEHLVTQFSGMEEKLFTRSGNLHGYVGIYLNGMDCYPGELAKTVKDGDELYILYIIGGG